MSGIHHYAALDKIVGVFNSWIPVVDKTVLLQVPGLDEALAPLGESLGFDIGMLKVGRSSGVVIRGWVGVGVRRSVGRLVDWCGD
jgi:hypothetical protein